MWLKKANWRKRNRGKVLQLLVIWHGSWVPWLSRLAALPACGTRWAARPRAMSLDVYGRGVFAKSAGMGVGPGRPTPRTHRLADLLIGA